MPAYDEALQNKFLLALHNLLLSYGFDLSSLKDNSQFKADFMDLIIEKDRQEAYAIGKVLKKNVTVNQWEIIKNIILSNFTEYTSSEIGD